MSISEYAIRDLIYEDRDAAITAALEETEPGGYVTIHADECALSRDLECDCKPEMWGPVGVASA